MGAGMEGVAYLNYVAWQSYIVNRRVQNLLGPGFGFRDSRQKV